MFYYDVAGGDSDQEHWAWPHSPIKHVSFEPFRRAGFAIWGERRMRAGGFFGPPPLLQRNDFDSCVTAWRGILTTEMLDEVARENEQHHVSSDSEGTDSDAGDPGERAPPRFVVRSDSFRYRNRK